MEENLDLNINIETKGSEVLGIIRKELKEANGELLKAQTLYGDYSKEAIKAAQKVALLKDKIQEARETSDLFDPGKKFQALTGTLSAVAGGFGAIQGAMAIFGAESDNVQKALLRVNAAMALSQGLSTIKDSMKDFERLGTIIKANTVYQQANNVVNVIATTIMRAFGVSVDTTSVAFTRLKIAIAATGIGLLVAGIALAVTAFENFTSAADKAEEAQKKLNKQVQDGAKIQLEGEVASLDRQQKLAVSQAKAKGNSEAEIYKIEQTYRQLKIHAQQRYYNDIANIDAKAAADTQNAIKNTLNDAEIARFAEQERLRKEKETASQKTKDDRLKEQERNQASIKANQEFELKIQQDLLKLDEENAAKKRAIEFQKNEDLISDLDYKNALLDIDFEDDQQRLANKEAYLLEQKNIELSNLNLTELERVEVIAKYAKMERDIDKDITASKKAEQEARVNLQLQYIGFAEQAGNLLGQIAGKSKAVAIAGLLIEKGAAIAKIITQMMSVPAILPPGIPNPAFVPARIGGGLSIASVIAASAQGIASINSAASGGGSGGGIPAISTQSPMIPQIPTAQVTQLNQQSINDIGNQAVRAYVIESDITSNQQRITAIRQRARFS